MLKTYIVRESYSGTKLLNATEHEQDGVPGYTVIFPGGGSNWWARATFEDVYRELTGHERQLLTMTDAEAAVNAISDGDQEAEKPND